MGRRKNSTLTLKGGIMTNEEKQELIKKYAPILWIHEKDYFIPEDCRIMEQVAQVGKSSDDMRPFTLDDLGDLDDSQDYHMDIPDIDYSNFAMGIEYASSEIGPERLAALVRQKYSNNPFLNLNARDPLPKYHGRVSKITIEKGSDNDSRVIENRDPGAFGTYDVIQYYFFFLYNDSWNQHISDWDSTLEIFIKDNKKRIYAMLHMHHTRWMMKFSGQPKELKTWIDDWQKVENKKIGWMSHYALHPFVYIANGAHGGYATPGFSLHGTKLPGHKIITQDDCRQIGKICVYPDYEPVTQMAILNMLNRANIDTSQTKFISWEEPIILDKQLWLKYKGLWGAKSEYSGWGGATGPSRKSFWRMTQRRFKRALVEALYGEYVGNWPFKILRNWHGWI